MSRKKMNMLKTIQAIIGAIIICPFLFMGCGNEELSERMKYIEKTKKTDQAIVPMKEYTRNVPGEWTGMEDEHIPIIIRDGNKIVIRVNLKKPGPTHFIEKIGIMDKDKKDLAGKVFSPHSKSFEAHFPRSVLPADLKGVKVYAKCNIHDLWTVELKE